MAIFYHPPQPHIGGRQPLEPRKLPPSITAVPEDDPPFGLRQPFWPIIYSWQPGPPIFRKQITVLQEAVVAADNPPFGLRQSLLPIIAAWQLDPQIFQRQITILQEGAVSGPELRKLITITKLIHQGTVKG